jgi:hypothetical protein
MHGTQAAGFIAAVTFRSAPPPKCENDKYGGDCSVDYCLGSRTLAGSGEVTAAYRNNAACGWLIEAETDSNVIQVSALQPH